MPAAGKCSGWWRVWQAPCPSLPPCFGSQGSKCWCSEHIPSARTRSTPCAEHRTLGVPASLMTHALACVGLSIHKCQQALVSRLPPQLPHLAPPPKPLPRGTRELADTAHTHTRERARARARKRERERDRERKRERERERTGGHVDGEGAGLCAAAASTRHRRRRRRPRAGDINDISAPGQPDRQAALLHLLELLQLLHARARQGKRCRGVAATNAR